MLRNMQTTTRPSEIIQTNTYIKYRFRHVIVFFKDQPAILKDQPATLVVFIVVIVTLQIHRHSSKAFERYTINSY